MHDNAPPRLLVIGEVIGLLVMLSRPDGLGRMAAEIQPLLNDALDAYARLGETQETTKAGIDQLEQDKLDLAKQRSEFDQYRDTFAAQIAALPRDRKAFEDERDAARNALADDRRIFEDDQARLAAQLFKVDADAQELNGKQRLYAAATQQMAKQQEQLTADRAELTKAQQQLATDREQHDIRVRQIRAAIKD